MESNERTVYVVYVPEHGFIKNKGGMRKYTTNYLSARIYNKEGHAKSSLYPSEKDDAYIIPVKMILDPQDMFIAIMGFK